MTRSISPDVRQSLEAVLGYLAEERDDFERSTPDQRAQHIYRHVATLAETFRIEDRQRLAMDTDDPHSIMGYGAR